MTILVPDEFLEKLLESLKENGELAITVEEFPSHETYQFKGRYLRHRAVQEDDGEMLSACVAGSSKASADVRRRSRRHSEVVYLSAIACHRVRGARDISADARTGAGPASFHRWSNEMPMTRLPPEIRPVLENGTPAAMVTCSADGKPNTTVISQVYYVDETHVALSFQFFSKTIRNVRENPRAFVLRLRYRRAGALGAAAAIRAVRNRGPGLRRDGHADRGHRLDDRYVRHLQAPRSRYLSCPFRRAGPAPTLDRFVVERVMSNLRILQRVSADINSTLDLDEICDVALRTMDELFEFHHANILLLEPDNNTLKVTEPGLRESGCRRTGAGWDRRDRHGRAEAPVDARQQPGTAARLCVGAASRDGEGRSACAAWKRDPGARTSQRRESDRHSAAHPRRSDRGVLNREPVPRSFGEHERDLVSIVANQIASAIHNARLYEQQRLAAKALHEANLSLETGSPNEPRRSNANCVSRRRSSTKRAVAWRGPCSGEAPSSEACAMQSLVRPGRSSRFSRPARRGLARKPSRVHDATRAARARSFVRCGEITPQHRHGVETKALRSPEESFIGSRFELASRGTVFFDAVHELPLDLQRALHTTLEEARRRPATDSSTGDVRHDWLDDT